MADVDSDVKINVGAEAKLDGATQQILAEFSQVEERLVRIGTAEANALAKQLKAAASGLAKGILSADDVENVAMAFSGITKDAQLTDSAISDLATSFSDAVDNSRALSDWMRKSAESGEEAKASLSEMLGEFSKMEERLTRIGTADAKALAKQLKEAMWGLKDGMLTADDMEEVAAAFSGITEDAQLTDNAIDSLSTSFENAVKNSRNLSDFMNKTGKHGSAARVALKGMSDALDKMNPSASRLSSEVGTWVQKIPGVEKLMGKMPMVATGIGVAFKAATALIMTTISAMKEYQAAVRSFTARNLDISGENARNRQTNRVADAELAARKRREELEDTQALRDTEHELFKIKKEQELYDMQATTPYAREREINELNHRREIEEQEIDLKRKRNEEAIKANEQDSKTLDEQKQALDDRIKAEESRYNIMTKLQQKYQSMVGEKTQKANEQAKSEAQRMGLTEGSKEYNDYVAKQSESLISKWMGGAKSWVSDNISDLAASVGLKELSTSDAEQLWKEYADKERSQKQTLEELKRQRQGLDADSDRLDRQKKNLETQKNVIEKMEMARTSKNNAEEAARKNQIMESVANRRVEMMGAGDRLTAMGLGGGNAVVDSGKKIASNTDEIKQILKDYVRQGIKLAPGQHMSGRADTSPIANYNPLVWPK
jgi:hypothetical protein